jgi:hypothetical protein
MKLLNFLLHVHNIVCNYFCCVFYALSTDRKIWEYIYQLQWPDFPQANIKQISIFRNSLAASRSSYPYRRYVNNTPKYFYIIICVYGNFVH